MTVNLRWVVRQRSLAMLYGVTTESYHWSFSVDEGFIHNMSVPSSASALHFLEDLWV